MIKTSILSELDLVPVIRAKIDSFSTKLIIVDFPPTSLNRNYSKATTWLRLAIHPYCRAGLFKTTGCLLQPPDDYCRFKTQLKHKNLHRLVGMGTFLTLSRILQKNFYAYYIRLKQIIYRKCSLYL